MSKIALCWELGGGLGHISVLAPLAHYYIEQGHEVICVLKSGTTKYREIFPKNVVLFSTPSTLKSETETLSSYSDILWHIGYQDINWLQNSLNNWRNIFKQQKCDIIICDHSPTARLAAHSLNLKHAAIGTGFCCPPAKNPYPKFEIASKKYSPKDIESILLKNINQSLDKLQCSPIEQISKVLSHSNEFLCTLPHLDHYTRDQPQDYWGPIITKCIGHSFTWPNKHPYKIFCYLKSNVSNLNTFAEAFNLIEADKVIYIGGTKINNTLFDSSTVILTNPAKIESITSNANLVISHGGHNLTAQLLMAGIPNLLIPMFMEQSILAHKLQQQGLCSVCFLDDSIEKLVIAINKSLEDKQLSDNTRLFSQHYYGYDSDAQLEDIAESILEIEQ